MGDDASDVSGITIATQPPNGSFVFPTMAQNPGMTASMPAMVPAPQMGIAAQMGPPQMGVAPQMGPPQMGPPRMGPPQMGPPQMGPPQMGPPQMVPPQMGPPSPSSQMTLPPQMVSGSQMNIQMGPPQMAPPQMGPPQMGPPQMGPPQMAPPQMGPSPQMGPPQMGPPPQMPPSPQMGPQAQMGPSPQTGPASITLPPTTVVAPREDWIFAPPQEAAQSMPNLEQAAGFGQGSMGKMEPPLSQSMGALPTTAFKANLPAFQPGSSESLREAPGLAPGLQASMDPRLVQSMGVFGSGSGSTMQVTLPPPMPTPPPTVSEPLPEISKPPEPSIDEASREAVQRLESQFQSVVSRLDQQSRDIQNMSMKSMQQLPQQVEYVQYVAPQPPQQQNTQSYKGSYNFYRTWEYGLFECCSPLQCLAACFCPCLVTYDMFVASAPFELAGFGCLVSGDSALILTILFYLLYLFSFSILFYILMLSAIVGIKRKFLVEESHCVSCLKMCCCLCCYQTQIIRQVELVGAATSVAKPMQYGSMAPTQQLEPSYQSIAYVPSQQQQQVMGYAQPQQQARSYLQPMQPPQSMGLQPQVVYVQPPQSITT